MRLKIGPKLILSFIAVGVIFFACTAYSLVRFQSLQQQLREVGQETYPALDLTTGLLRLLNETEAVFKEAVEDLDQELLDQTEQTTKQFSAHVARLKALTDDPETIEINTLYEGYVQLGQETVRHYLQTTDLEALRGKLASLDEIARRLTTTLEDYHRLKYQTFEESLQAIERSGELMSRAMVIATVVALGVGLLIALVMTRTIVGPLGLLTNAARRIGQGDLSTQVDITSGDELAELSSTLNKMTKDLRLLIEKEQELRAAATTAVVAEKKRATELDKTYRKLQEAQSMLIQAGKLEAVGELAAGVAHEVKNPLMVILQGADYLSRHLPAGDDTAVEVLKKIDDAVMRANSIVRGLLDFSAPSEFEMAIQDLNVVVEQSFLLVKHEFDRSHVTVVRALGEDLPHVSLDRNKMQQVFVNLFTNAIHAMPKGGTLTVRTYAKQLTDIDASVFDLRKPDRFRIGETVAMTEIEDTGSGIPEDQLTKIFNPFFSTKPSGEGTGLGLVVTQKIVELHGGTITIRNNTERGVRVIVVLRC